MKRERGFTLIETLLAIAIIAFLAIGAAAVAFQVLPGSDRTNRISADTQVQDAGYWISRDGEVAESVFVNGLDPLQLVVMTWTERDYQSGTSVYHSATYSLENVSDNIGDLKRRHWSNAGAHDETIVANHIYYNPADADYTSKATYEKPVLTVRLTSWVGDARETKEYCIARRPNF